jgi:hypothetical protein
VLRFSIGKSTILDKNLKIMSRSVKNERKIVEKIYKNLARSSNRNHFGNKTHTISGFNIRLRSLIFPLFRFRFDQILPSYIIYILYIQQFVSFSNLSHEIFPSHFYLISGKFCIQEFWTDILKLFSNVYFFVEIITFSILFFSLSANNLYICFKHSRQYSLLYGIKHFCLLSVRRTS